MAEKTKIEKVTDAAKKLSSPLASLLGKQETIKSLKEKKEKVYHSKDGKPYLISKVGEKIHKAAQKQKQDAYAPKSPRNEKMAKGGRAGYKGGKSVKKMGCAIKGRSKILR